MAKPAPLRCGDCDESIGTTPECSTCVEYREEVADHRRDGVRDHGQVVRLVRDE